MSVLLTSRGRYKILKVIYDYGEVNISRIARETGLNYSYVRKYLNELKSAGIVNERIFGRAKMYSINYTSSKALLVRDLLRVLDEVES